MMKGKVCLVTGANGSLGKATAIVLAQLGATVILACSDKSICRKAAAWFWYSRNSEGGEEAALGRLPKLLPARQWKNFVSAF